MCDPGAVGLLGMEAFLSLISCRQDSSTHDLPWVPRDRFKRLLINREAADKPPETKLKGPEKLVKIRRPKMLRPYTYLSLASSPTLLKPFQTLHKKVLDMAVTKQQRRNTNASLLLPWYLSHIPAWLDVCVCPQLLIRLHCPWDFPSKNTGVGCHFLLQEIFLTHGSNLCLLHLLHWQADSLTLGHLIPQQGPGAVHSSWAATLLSSPFGWQRNTATLSSSSITLSPYFCSTSVHRESRFWQKNDSFAKFL